MFPNAIKLNSFIKIFSREVKIFLNSYLMTNVVEQVAGSSVSLKDARHVPLGFDLQIGESFLTFSVDGVESL